jgi:hypothetical protein
MKRSLIIAALAAAALPAAADAKEARFVAYVEGKQLTTWQIPRHQDGVRDCKGAQFKAQSGSETVRFSTKPARLLAYKPNAGAGVTVKYGTWSRFAAGKPALKGAGPMTRAFTETVDHEPGPCGAPAPEEPGVTDCRADRWKPEVRLSWNGSRVSVDADEAQLRFVECTLFVPTGVYEQDFTGGVEQRYPARDLFDRSQGLVEVLGRKTFSGDLPFGGTTTTTITWKLRLRRAR